MSKVHTLISQAALVAALTVAATPSFGQEKYHGRQKEASGQSSSGQQQSGEQSRERAQPRSGAPARSEAPRAQAAAPRPQAGAAPGVTIQPQPAPAPRAQQAVPRAEPRREDSRANNRSGDNHANDTRRYESGQAVPRGNVYAPRGNVYAPRYDPHYSTHYAPHYVPRGYGYYGTRSYYRPYVYRPYYSIGFGIYAGYPVPYTYTYADPIWVYGYRAPRERVVITPGSPYYGGVALEITPYDADVFVDGEYAGRAEEFDGSKQPLTLASGVHRIEVQAQGFAPLLFNVEIRAGQIIPYRGDLRPY